MQILVIFVHTLSWPLHVLHTMKHIKSRLLQHSANITCNTCHFDITCFFSFHKLQHALYLVTHLSESSDGSSTVKPLGRSEPIRQGKQQLDLKHGFKLTN